MQSDCDIKNIQKFMKKKLTFMSSLNYFSIRHSNLFLWLVFRRVGTAFHSLWTTTCHWFVANT